MESDPIEDAKRRLAEVRASGKFREPSFPDHYLTATGLNDVVLPSEARRRREVAENEKDSEKST